MERLACYRIGGALTPGCDPMLKNPVDLPKNRLLFSHGRAAFSWLLANRGPFGSAAVCAYTWPAIPRMMERLRLKVGFYDYGSGEIARIVRALPGRCFVLIPSFYGFRPWVNPYKLANELGDKACVLIDAAQTGFGHLDYKVPVGGAVMSCPHKATALDDGAVLVVDNLTEDEAESVRNLPQALEFNRIKHQGRVLLGSGDPQKELEGLDVLSKLEESWPSDSPQRMTDMSIKLLAHLDPSAHARIRINNRIRLREKLEERLPSVFNSPGTPFGHPILVDNREELLGRLHAKRVFATRLWYNAIFDEKLHPVAADYSRRLLALPVDQRYNEEDMDFLADLVTSCL